MLIKGLEKRLRNPRGFPLKNADEGYSFIFFGEFLSRVCFASFEGMTQDQRSEAFQIGVRLASILNKIDEDYEKVKEKDQSSGKKKKRPKLKGEYLLKLTSEEATLLKKLAAGYGTLFYGLIEKHLEEGGILEEDIWEEDEIDDKPST